MADKIPSEWSVATIAALQQRLSVWTNILTGAYASATTFLFTGTDKDVALIKKSIFTCTDSAGTTRRCGYVKSAVNNSGTITVTVITDTDLASGDKDFKIWYHQKVYPFIHRISILGQLLGDVNNSIGLWDLDQMEAMKVISSSVKVRTPAAGAGAAMTWNIYADGVALYATAPNLGSAAYLRDQRPTTIDVAEGADITLRVLTSAGATNFASNAQFRIVKIPASLFLTA